MLRAAFKYEVQVNANDIDVKQGHNFCLNELFVDAYITTSLDIFENKAKRKKKENKT